MKIDIQKMGHHYRHTAPEVTDFYKRFDEVEAYQPTVIDTEIVVRYNCTTMLGVQYEAPLETRIEDIERMACNDFRDRVGKPDLKDVLQGLYTLDRYLEVEAPASYARRVLDHQIKQVKKRIEATKEVQT